MNVQLIRNTRVKIVVVMMLILAVIFAAGGIMSTGVFRTVRSREAENSINQIITEVRSSKPHNPLTVKNGFCVRLSESDAPVVIVFDDSVFAQPGILAYARALPQTGGRLTRVSGAGLIYKTDSVAGQTLLAAIDSTAYDRTVRNWSVVYVCISAFVLMLLFLAVYLLSGWIVSPFAPKRAD